MDGGALYRSKESAGRAVNAPMPCRRLGREGPSAVSLVSGGKADDMGNFFVFYIF